MLYERHPSKTWWGYQDHWRIFLKGKFYKASTTTILSVWRENGQREKTDSTSESFRCEKLILCPRWRQSRVYKFGIHNRPFFQNYTVETLSVCTIRLPCIKSSLMSIKIDIALSICSISNDFSTSTVTSKGASTRKWYHRVISKWMDYIRNWIRQQCLF